MVVVVVVVWVWVWVGGVGCGWVVVGGVCGVGWGWVGGWVGGGRGARGGAAWACLVLRRARAQCCGLLAPNLPVPPHLCFPAPPWRCSPGGHPACLPATGANDAPLQLTPPPPCLPYFVQP